MIALDIVTANSVWRLHPPFSVATVPALSVPGPTSVKSLILSKNYKPMGFVDSFRFSHPCDIQVSPAALTLLDEPYSRKT